MKLHEIHADPGDVLDNDRITRDIDAGKLNARTTARQVDVKSKPPRKDSNIEKARRIRTLAKMKAKEANQNNTDDTAYHGPALGTPAPWEMGGL